MSNESLRIERLNHIYREVNSLESPSGFTDTMDAIIDSMRHLFSHPSTISIRIAIDGHIYETADFIELGEVLSTEITFGDRKRGDIEVFQSRKNFSYSELDYLCLQNLSLQLSTVLFTKEIIEKRDDLENQLLHADRLAKIGQLAAGIAHELNNPLNDVLGFSQLSLNIPDLPEQVYEDLEKIYKSSLFAREIVRKLMFFSRQLPRKQTRIAINNLIKEWLYLLESRCQKNNIEVIQEYGNIESEFTGDSSQLSQVIVNIVINAIQAMPEGGTLKVKTSGTESEIHIYISDTGVGMNRKTLDQIFIPFFTTKDVNQGMGLGLSVVHGIISDHEGAIDVQSEEGKGTIFQITLPIKHTGS